MTDANGDGKPPWSDELARQFIGKHIIIGITRLTADDEPLGQQQMHGDIVAVDAKNGIGICRAGSGEMYWLPPDLRSIQVAPLGEYRFRSTGEVVVNPDLMTTCDLPPNPRPRRLQPGFDISASKRGEQALARSSLGRSSPRSPLACGALVRKPSRVLNRSQTIRTLRVPVTARRHSAL